MLLAHKIELRPTPGQREYLEKACGHRRHCWNHMLAWFSQKNSDGNVLFKWSKTEAYQFFMKVLRVEFPFYSEVSSVITRNVIDDLDNAYSQMFRRMKSGEKAGYPRPRKKGQRESFSIRDVAKFDVKNKMLRIEKLKTRIEMRQNIRFSGKLKQVTISKRADKFYASFLIETLEYDSKDIDRKEMVGLDFGLKQLVTTSDNEQFPACQLFKKNICKLQKLQRNLARKERGSMRRAKTKLKIQKLHAKIARQREAILHQISDYVTKTYDTIVLEDLHINGMMKLRSLSRAIADAGFGVLRQMIEYKAKLRNCTVIIADRFFPSSKKCSHCGGIKQNLTLSDRSYKCDSCGIELDRDFNAAINLCNYGLSQLKSC